MSTRQQQASLAAKTAKADSLSSKADKPGPVDPEILAAIKIAIQPVVDAQTTIQVSQNAITKKLDQAMGELASIREKVDALETSVQASDSRVETVITDALPSITTHISSITTALAMRQLELEVHRRKWALGLNIFIFPQLGISFTTIIPLLCERGSSTHAHPHTHQVNSTAINTFK